MTAFGRTGDPMPMFPLGTVLVPHGFLSLQVFEPRYRVLMFDCLRGDREFGVVLIERGSEIGGADQRFAVATVARVVEATELPDGRWYLLTVGIRRVDVVQWLPDDPYPIALVVGRPELPWPGAGVPAGAALADGTQALADGTQALADGTQAAADGTQAAADGTLAAADRAVRRLLDLAAEVGSDPRAAPFELASDPVVRGWQLVAVAPIGSLDKQRLLAVDDHAERLGALAALAEEQAILLAYHLHRE